MTFGIMDFVEVLGAISFFIFGMKMMSDGIQRAAGSEMRNILSVMTKNRFLGVFTGFITTAIVQSSSATTVMTVSFVNAGLLTVVESAGIMMGANIGTTITGWLVSLLGFKVKLEVYSIPLFAVGVPLLFTNKGKLKYWGEFLIGFAIIFLGLNYLVESVPDIKSNPEFLSFLQNFTNWGFLSRIFFVVIGMLITMVTQSSSVAMTVTLALCAQGWLPFEIAACMILGVNIGTTITAELASLVGNTNAKRSARIHTLFNIIGVMWMVVALPYFLPVLSSLLQQGLHMSDPYLNPKDMPISLSAFHTAFNTMNMILLIGFIPALVKLASWTVISKEETEDPVKIKFISNHGLTPELATIEIQKEATLFGEITKKMSESLYILLNTTKVKDQNKMLKKLKKYEEITDDMEVQITEYITKLSDNELTPQTSIRLRSYLNICNDLERIGDIYYQISKALEKKIEDNIYFLPEQRDSLNQMIAKLDEAFDIMINNLNTPNYNKVNKSSAVAIEKEINSLRNTMRDTNTKQLGNLDYNVNSAFVYNNIFSSLEKIGDHILNVTESIVGEI